MPKIAYLDKRVRPETMQLIVWADATCADYAARGYNLTLRQLYYQGVTQNLYPNVEQSYDRLGRIVSDGRLMGLIDWNHVNDNHRDVSGTGWVGAELPSISALVRELKYGVSHDLWEGQRLRGYIRAGQRPVVIHIGDHDPSGIDMTRDIEDRLALFTGGRVEVRRLALNFDQVDEFNLAPNPAKQTDSRFAEYALRFGSESWELDAIRPETLVDIVQREIQGLIDFGVWQERVDEENAATERVEAVADRWDEVMEFLGLEDE